MTHNLSFEPTEWSTMLTKRQSSYDQSTNLPTVYLSNSKQIQTPSAEVHNARVLKENNMNLTALQKELLHWHFWLCHQGFDSLQ